MAVDTSSPRSLLHVASLKIESREDPAKAVPQLRSATVKAAAREASAKPVAAPKTAARKAPQKTVDKTALSIAKPVTKPVRLAKNDPLAPLPGKPSKKTAKDSGSAR